MFVFEGFDHLSVHELQKTLSNQNLPQTPQMQGCSMEGSRDPPRASPFPWLLGGERAAPWSSEAQRVETLHSKERRLISGPNIAFSV